MPRPADLDRFSVAVALVIALAAGCGRSEGTGADTPASTGETDEIDEARPAPSARGAGPEPPTGACTDPESCYASGKTSLGRGDHARARGLFEKACTGGHGAACFRLGAMYRDGRGVDADEAGARSWFERACAAGSTRGCDALGH